MTILEAVRTLRTIKLTKLAVMVTPVSPEAIQDFAESMREWANTSRQLADKIEQMRRDIAALKFGNEHPDDPDKLADPDALADWEEAVRRYGELLINGDRTTLIDEVINKVRDERIARAESAQPPIASE